MRLQQSLALGISVLLGSTAAAQHAQTSAVAVNPTDSTDVWTANRDNNSVSRVDVAGGVTTNQIDVGIRPRTLAITQDGSTVYVANQRGDIGIDVNFVQTGFSGSEVRGSVSVIDTATNLVTTTITDVGVEPYGVAVAPNGKYFAVSTMRSGAVVFYDTATNTKLLEYEFLDNLDFIPSPFTLADVDANRDGIPDLSDPRGFVIRSDSQKIYVTHFRSPYVSALDVTLDVNGLPTAVTLASKINTDDYTPQPYLQPTNVQSVSSQGDPRFLEDIALSPDGARALVPHVIHNVNHDVNFDFTLVFPGGIPGDFANRVYPALTMIDATSDSYGQPGDASVRLHNQLDDPLRPAAYVPVGNPGNSAGGSKIYLGGIGAPVIGGTLEVKVEGIAPGHTALLVVGPKKVTSQGGLGFNYAGLRFSFPVPANGIVSLPIPNAPSLEGQTQTAQVRVFDSFGLLDGLSNGLDIYFSAEKRDTGKMGQRAGQPSRVAFSPAGDRVLMLNRGSEDVFLYDVGGSDMTMLDVHPRRHEFTERAPLDTTTSLGDTPMGMAIVEDTSTPNDDALVYILNEVTRTLSTLRVSWSTGTIFKDEDQIPLLLNPDADSLSKRVGQELFEDASRAQTTGAPGSIGEFNNSCASCHFEGGEDGNVWQRPAGPRSTMPIYDGTLLTGLILWKGVRLNLGETGPMFGGENGGHGILTDAQQQGLIDYHEKIPVPLNGNWDPVTNQLTTQAQFGSDLFHGENTTGLNPNLRAAGCAECHPKQDPNTLEDRAFTGDFLNPNLTSGENLETEDPFCFNLQGNIVSLNIRNVNSGVNLDFDGDGSFDPTEMDRNADGFIDIETYVPLNPDTNDDFTRDDPNSYMCPEDPNDPNGPLKLFLRDMREFSIPTKLGVITSGPYMHDHSLVSLRAVLDPAAQMFDPIYGEPAYGGQGSPLPGTEKFFNEFHDIRGHEDFVQGASKVQLNLGSYLPGNDVDQDIEALLAYIQSL